MTPTFTTHLLFSASVLFHSPNASITIRIIDPIRRNIEVQNRFLSVM
jgi:hypothetical protein